MRNEYPLYSVLMSVYYKENPDYFKTAVQSMLDQTIVTDDFVIVCDGPLTQELNNVLSEFISAFPDRFQVLRLDKNQGLGNALNAGLELCRYELIARMDSDDISLPHRCEYQLEAFADTPELSLCSSDIAEFESDPDIIQSIRYVPKTHKEILKYATKRNPINHMAVMFKKSAVKEAGGYIEIKMAEDYYLWARMLKNGCLAMNIDKVLVKVRVGNGMYLRRGGVEYIKSICSLQKKFLTLHFITYPEYFFNCSGRILSGMLPSYFRKRFYQRILRNRRPV